MNFDVEMDLVVTLAAVFVAGLAAVLGIWMERDRRKPPRYAWALSALIVLATLVSLMQSYLDQKEQDKLREDMARLLATMDRIASESDNPELLDLVKSELNAQSRSDPAVVEKMAQRVSDEGRDPAEVLGKHLDAAELEKVSRKTASIKPKQTEHVATAEKPRPKPQTPAATDDADGKEAVRAPSPEAKAAATTPTPSGKTPQELAAEAAAAAAAAQARATGRPVPGVPPGAVAPPAAPAPTPEAVAAPAKPAGARPGIRVGVKPGKPKPPTPRKPKGK